MKRALRVPTLVVAALALAITGCGGRKTKPPSEVVEKPPVEATPAPTSDVAASDIPETPDFDSTGGSDPSVWSGDLPLGERQPEISGYDEPAGWDLGPDPSSAPSGDPMADPAVQALFDDVRFTFDSYRLAPADRRRLTETGRFLRENPGWSVLVEGHCDERGDAAYNLALGEKRALTVREFLASTGVAPGRLSTVSYGEERPLVRGYGEEAWAANRRAHFRVREP
jgi:peptidoglycan-associated lipoprotein